MIGFPIALALANAAEWYLHKHVLHGIPDESMKRRRKSPLPLAMKRHWAHHNEVRRHEFVDADYRDFWRHERMRGEIKGLVVLPAIAGTVIAPVAPFFALGVWYTALNYWRTHRKSHLDPEWAKTHVPWHYDHHMNKNQDANWCVTKPWFDYVMGTRVVENREHAETNPLGIKLPRVLAKVARRFTPTASAA